jgi:DNA-binding CsgD family transcriptional regulator
MSGNAEAAVGLLRDLPTRMLEAGSNDPTMPLWADAIEALLAVGDLDQARAILEPYAESGRGLESPWACAAAARCGGLLAAAEGDLESALTAFDISLADAAPFPLERARTLLCLGTVRRQAQQKKAAREALEEATAIFEELGGRLWAEKARAEMARIGGRAPGPDELTGSERSVAGLAAQGRTNKEIAAELFMGVSTVEAHLTHVYRKLGVRSRTELAGRLDVAASDAPVEMRSP